MKLETILEQEMAEFRQNEIERSSEEVYDDFYKIHFFEAIYNFLFYNIENIEHIEKLSKIKRPICWLFNQWLSTDGCFFEDWDNIRDDINQILNESEEAE